MTRLPRSLRALAVLILMGAGALLATAAPAAGQWNSFLAYKSYRLRLTWIAGDDWTVKDKQGDCTTTKSLQASLGASVSLKLVRSKEGRSRFAAWRSEKGAKPQGNLAYRVHNETRSKCKDDPETFFRMTHSGGGIGSGEGRFDLDTQTGEYRVFGFVVAADGSVSQESGPKGASGTAPGGLVLHAGSGDTPGIPSDITGTAEGGAKSIRGTPIEITGDPVSMVSRKPGTLTWSLEPWEEDEDEMLFEVGPEYDKWIPAPRPEDLPGIALDPGEDAWKPLMVRVSIRTKKDGNTGRSGKIRFTLEDVSKNAGYAINFPQGGKSKADLRFAKEQPDGIEVKGARVTGASTIVDVAETKEKVAEATVILESLDPGAYGKLKAACEELNLKALFKPTNTYALAVPRDDDDNHLADAWEEKRGTKGREATWDKVSIPGQPSQGDGLALYEKYRGAVVLENDTKTWKRLPTEEKLLFVVDEKKELMLEAWKKASGITAFRVGRDGAKAGSTPEASAVVNSNASAIRNGNKYAVVLTEKATGDEAAVAGGGGNSVLGETSAGNRPADITSCLIYPDRIRGGLRFTMTRVQFAIDHYDEKLGVMSRIFTKEELLRVLAQMRDPAVFQRLYIQSLHWTAIHELGHACGIVGHMVGADESSEGAVQCFMRYLSKDEGRVSLLQQALDGALLPLAPGIDAFCRDGYNCLGHMDVHDH